MNDRDTIKTYILVTTDSFYCGKTNDIQRRMEKHKKEKIPHWFGFKDRKNFSIGLIIDGDFEKEIKRFGVEKFYDCVLNIRGVSLS